MLDGDKDLIGAPVAFCRSGLRGRELGPEDVVVGRVVGLEGDVVVMETPHGTKMRGGPFCFRRANNGDLKRLCFFEDWAEFSHLGENPGLTMEDLV